VSTADTPAIVDDGSRFVATVDGREAELRYRRDGDRLVLVHTEVPDELEGRGLGGALVRAALGDAAAAGATIVPQCPFVRGWLERHRADLGDVPVDW